METIEVESFRKELEEVKKTLPPRYTAVLEYEGFTFKKGDVYNVVNKGIMNREILDALKMISRRSLKKFENK
jgi:hypothetical protein